MIDNAKYEKKAAPHLEAVLCLHSGSHSKEHRLSLNCGWATQVALVHDLE